MDAPRPPNAPRQRDPTTRTDGSRDGRFAPPPLPALAARRGLTPDRRGGGKSRRGKSETPAGAAGAPPVIKGRTVGHGGRTMTYRVWPLWMRVAQILFGLALAAAALVGIRQIDADGLRLPFGLGVPGFDDDEDDEAERGGRGTAWTTRPETVPVLMYRLPSDRHIRLDGAAPVTPARFDEHLAHLATAGYTTVTASDYLAALDGAPLPARPVLVTIDGPAAAGQAFVPVLEQRGMVATFFIPGTGGALDAGDAVRQLLDVGEVGGQPDTPGLSALTAADQQTAIAGNRAWLEEVTGEPVVAFAYPDGEYDEHTVPALAAVGYRLAFDAWGGLAPVTDPAANRWHLARIEVGPNDDAKALAAKLAGEG